jgi:hypothetical protein
MRVSVWRTVTLFLLVAFAAPRAHSQSLEEFRQELNRYLDRISSLQAEPGDKYDSLELANAQLALYFKKHVPLIPSLFSDTASLGVHHVVSYNDRQVRAIPRVGTTMSLDSAIKIWTWNTWTGGSMPRLRNIVAFKSANRVRVVDLQADDGWSGQDRGENFWFDTIYCVTAKSGEKIYLPIAYWRGDGRHIGVQFNAFRLTGRKLDTRVQLFPLDSWEKEQKNQTHSIAKSFCCEDCPPPDVSFDAVKQELSVQDTEVDASGKEVLSERRRVFKFDGKRFNEITPNR